MLLPIIWQRHATTTDLVCNIVWLSPVIFYKARAGQYPQGAALSFDDSVDITKVRSTLPPSTTIQGNLNPRWLLQPRDELISEVRRICDPLQKDPGFIFNVSRGILPETSEEAVRCLVDAVRGAL